MTVTIRTYLCNKRLVAIEVAARVSNHAVSFADGVVSAKIFPLGGDFRKKQVRAMVVSPDANIVECIEPEPILQWTRKALIYGDDFFGLETLITIEANIPSLFCIWDAAHIYGITLSPADHNVLLVSTPDRSGGEIPDNKSDACKIVPWITARNTQTNIVPGELLQLAWTIKVNDQTYQKPVAGAWFDTPVFNGGIILGKQDEKYSIKLHGLPYVCLPTDWAQYQTGDWGYVLKQGESKAGECDRADDYGMSGMPCPSSDNRLVPIRVNAFGNATGVFEKIAYSMMTGYDFGRFFETSLHEGTIVETPEENLARVIVEKLGVNRDQSIEYVDVAIFYHCEDATTITDGYKAFVEDDKVLVLNEGGGRNPSVADLTIIGFKDVLKRCSGDHILCVSERIWNTSWTIADINNPDAGMAFAWNIITGRLQVVLDEFDVPVEQPMNFVRLKFLLELPKNGTIDIWREEPAQTTEWSGGCGSYTRYPQTGELLPTGYEVEPVGLFTKAYLANYLENCPPTYFYQNVDGQPQWYYIKTSDTDYPWEAYYEIRQRTGFESVGFNQSIAASKLVDTPDSELTAGGMDLYVADPDDPPDGKISLLNMKVNYPCYTGVAPATHEWVRCSGDPNTDEFKKGPYLAIREFCCKGEPLAYMLCRPSECVDNFDDAEYEWRGLIENEDGSWSWTTWWVQSNPWPCTTGYRRLLGMGCGIKETDDIAVYFEFCHFQWCNESWTFKKFNLYYQLADEIEGYKMSRFIEAPNLSALRDLVFSFQYPASVWANNMFFKGDKVWPNPEKRPVFSLHKMLPVPVGV